MSTKMSEIGLGNTESTICPNWTYRTGTIAHGAIPIQDRTVHGYAVITGCGKWECEVCGRKKAGKLLKRLSLYTPTKFITLTVRPGENETPRQAFKRTSSKVTPLFKKLKRKPTYCRIVEATKAGYPHYHILANMSYVPKEDLSEAWAKLTGAWVVDVKQVSTKQVARYVTKYLTKQGGLSFTRQRVSFTRDWPKLDQQKMELQPSVWGQIDVTKEYLERLSNRTVDICPKLASMVCDDVEESDFFLTLKGLIDG